jgi:hypothetical protein
MKTKPSLVVSIALVIVILIIAFWYSQVNAPKSTPIVTPTPTAIPTPTVTPMPTSNPTATPNSRLTVTYSELSRNETMIVIQFKLEPNSYVFQLNATSFYLIEDAVRISTNTNDVVIIGTQYSTLFFPIKNYGGADYHLSSDVLPSDTFWIMQ